MCEIFNLSMRCGVFPDWKCSTIIPVEKITGTDKPEELRPINSMPTIEKIFEIIIKKQIDEYLDKNNIIAKQQSGFRRNHSCETALNHLIEEWRTDLDELLFAFFLT